MPSEIDEIRKRVLSRGAEKAPSQDQAEKATRRQAEELHQTEIERLERKAEVLRQENEKQNIALRRKLFIWVMVVVSVWLSVIACFMLKLLFVGIESKGDYSVMDPNIVITLLATTTVNIIGLPLVITQSLFKKENLSKDEKVQNGVL